MTHCSHGSSTARERTQERKPTWVCLRVSKSGTRITGIEHLSSVEVLVSPLEFNVLVGSKRRSHGSSTASERTQERKPTWVHLRVSESGTHITGMEHLSSVEVLVSP